jgi:hypothetical protein
MNRLRNALKHAVSTLFIMFALATVTVIVLQTVQVLTPTATAQVSRGGTSAGQDLTPNFREVTITPRKTSTEPYTLICYDKTGTQYFAINPTNLVLLQKVSGTLYTNRTLSITNGIGVTNGTLNFINGMLVQP